MQINGITTIYRKELKTDNLGNKFIRFQLKIDKNSYVAELKIHSDLLYNNYSVGDVVRVAGVWKATSFRRNDGTNSMWNVIKLTEIKVLNEEEEPW